MRTSSNLGNDRLNKSPYMVSLSGFIYFIQTSFVCLIGSIIINYLIDLESSYETVVVCTFVALVSIVIQFCFFSKHSGQKFSNYAIFLIAFAVFHFGLFFVYSVGGTYNYFYFKQYDVSVVLDTLLYEYISIEVLFLSGAWINRIRPFKFNSANRLSSRSICSISRICMILTGVVAFSLLALKTRAFLGGYYEGVRAFDSSVPSILGLIEYFYVPFSILTLIYSDNKQLNRMIESFVIIWALITALCGDRTSGLAGIMIIMLINVRYKSGERKTFRKYVISVATILLSGFLIVFIKSFREGNSFSGSGLFTILSEMLGELGSSFFPLTLIMRICPSAHDFLYGKSYFYSIISGCIPASLDPTGTIAYWNEKAIEPVNWIGADYDYTFGTGYSLCAEAYANFGWYGFVALFIVGLCIVKLLASDLNNKFSLYTSAVLMFEFFTLPRRNFYYVINHPVYCIIFVLIILLVFSRQFSLRIDGD